MAGEKFCAVRVLRGEDSGRRGGLLRREFLGLKREGFPLSALEPKAFNSPPERIEVHGAWSRGIKSASEMALESGFLGGGEGVKKERHSRMPPVSELQEGPTGEEGYRKASFKRRVLKTIVTPKKSFSGWKAGPSHRRKRDDLRNRESPQNLEKA